MLYDDKCCGKREKQGMDAEKDQEGGVRNFILVTQEDLTERVLRGYRITEVYEGNSISSSRKSMQKNLGARSYLSYLRNVIRPVWLELSEGSRQ